MYHRQYLHTGRDPAGDDECCSRQDEFARTAHSSDPSRMRVVRQEPFRPFEELVDQPVCRCRFLRRDEVLHFFDIGERWAGPENVHHEAR